MSTRTIRKLLESISTFDLTVVWAGRVNLIPNDWFSKEPYTDLLPPHHHKSLKRSGTSSKCGRRA